MSPQYEKVNDHTIRIITQKQDDVALTTLINNLKQLEAQKAQIETIIGNIREILKNATELGITPEEKDLNPINNKNE